MRYLEKSRAAASNAQASTVGVSVPLLRF